MNQIIKTMKYQKNQILYFKPNYEEINRCCWVCQIVIYIEKSNRYLVVLQDIYAPFHYLKSFVYEQDLGDISKTFVLDVVDLDDLKLNLTLKEVMKLQYYDLYK